MAYAQISTVPYNDITDAQISWLECQDFDLFVHITNGDTSLIRDFTANAMTIDEVLAELSAEEWVMMGEETDDTRLVKVDVGWHGNGDFIYKLAM